VNVHSKWKQHLVICVVLALLAVPVYRVDSFLFKAPSSGWISLDLSGLLIIPYLAFATLHIAVSSLALFRFPAAPLRLLHFVSVIVSLGLLVAGFVLYTGLESARSAAEYKKTLDTVEQLRNVLELREWWYVPSADAPQEIHARVKVHESGRFSGNADGRAAGNFGEMIFTTAGSLQRQVSRGEEFTYVFPLRRVKEGKAESVSIALYLFKDQTGSAPEDVTIIFENHPQSAYDGHFLYAQIPPPRPR
jgi:hypothetical protein